MYCLYVLYTQMFNIGSKLWCKYRRMHFMHFEDRCTLQILQIVSTLSEFDG